jgi:hypothetical protein
MYSWKITAKPGVAGTGWWSRHHMVEALLLQGFGVADVRTSHLVDRDGVDVLEVQHASRAAMTTFVLTKPSNVKPFEYEEVQ